MHQSNLRTNRCKYLPSLNIAQLRGSVITPGWMCDHNWQPLGITIAAAEAGDPAAINHHSTSLTFTTQLTVTLDA